METLPIVTTFPLGHGHDVNSRELCPLGRSSPEMKQIHALLLKTAGTQFQVLCSKNLNHALSILSHLELDVNPRIYHYNTIIQYLSAATHHMYSNSHSLDAVILGLYRQLLLKGLVPDSHTLPHVLRVCSRSQPQGLRLREGYQIHAHSIKTALVSNVYVKNTLMRLYAVSGNIAAVQTLFAQDAYRDLVSWTTLIQAFVSMGYAKEAILTFFQMCQADLRADEMTLVVVLSACSRLGDLCLGRKIHRYMHDNNVNSDVFVGNALIDMYMKCGDADLARKVFDEMPDKNVVSWNSMISGLAQQGEYKEALAVFREMQTLGFKPDDVTLVGVLNSCANLGVLELGKWVNAYIDKSHIKADGFIGNALVDMYAKCGSIDQAFRVFRRMKYKDVYSYTAMIVGFAMHGEAKTALGVFSDMSRAGIEPDEVTFVGVLSACSHAGLVEQGWRHFEEMSRVYNLKPQTEHYGCMVDLLGRAGRISEAEELIKNMPIVPDASIWGALLAACRIHAKVELGEAVMEKLVKMEPWRDGAYILMSNIYSSASRWKDALKWRKAMRERNMKKSPGCSSVEVDGVVHEFRKGDKSHPTSKELHKLLEEMMSHLVNNEEVYICHV